MPERNIDVRVRLKGADQFKSGMSQVEGSLSSFGGWLDVTKGILGSQIIQKGIQAIANQFNQAVDASMKFETATASLQKTAQLSDTALANMSMDIMDLSERVPMSSAAIAELADTVAHLGLDENQILPFTEVMIALGTATDMTAEEAATALARMANVMQTTTADYERLGSTIFELGRTSATTESEITLMATRMAGAASLVGMRESDVLAFAAALSSVGVEAASGATSIQKLATRFELMTASGSEDLERFAQIAGMTAAEFTSAWESDPALALAAFIGGLGNLNEEGGSAVRVLSELGITEVRLTRNVAGLAAAGDLLDRSLANSRRAWEENTALAEATGIAYGTTASKMQMAQNAIENAQIAEGDYLKGLALEVKEVQASVAKGLRESIMDNSLQKQLDNINEKYDQTGKNIENARDQAQALAQVLADMGNPEQLDTAGMEQYEATIGALIDLLPGVEKLYDRNTHTIQGGTEALKAYVAAQYEVAESANEMDRQAESLEAYGAKVEDLNELRKQQALAWAELKDAEAEYYALVESGAGESELTYSDEYARLMDADAAYSKVSKTVEECSEQLEKYGYIANDAAAAAENVNQALAGAEGVANSETKAVQQLTNQLDMYTEEAQQIIDDFYTQLEIAKKNVENVFAGTFYGKEEVEAQGIDETLGNLDQQMAYAEKYIENLQKVQELGLSADIVKELSDGSNQSAAILEGIVADNGAQIDTLNEKYASVQAAKEQMATAMAAASADVQARTAEVEAAIDNMVTNADQQAAASGATANTMQGMIDGIDQKLEVLRAKVNEANGIVASLGSGGGGDGGDGSHAAGLTYVPFDGYMAQLHRGEMVLTALEARAYRAEQYANYGMMANPANIQPANPGKGISPTLAADIASGVGAVVSQAVTEITKRPTVIKVGAKTIAKATAEYDAVEQNKRNRGYARGYGAGK